MSLLAADQMDVLRAGASAVGGVAQGGAQARWAALPISSRLDVLKRTRHLLAQRTGELVDAIPLHLPRTRADTLAAEVLPLLVACQFLEREAASILRTKRLGRRGLPFWLSGVQSSVARVPFGHVLVIGPSNYPLYLPGVQVLQALAAGNAVVWKPGTGGAAVAAVMQGALCDAGLPMGLLQVTGESVEDGVRAMQAGADKICFTGSAGAGRAVLHAAAESATPVTVELSGCDAVVVLPSADPVRVVAALAFGMRFNGSATCMAPRRLMLVGSGHESLTKLLQERFAQMPGIPLSGPVRTRLGELLDDAAFHGGTVSGDASAASMKPLLVLNGRPEMKIAQSDVFAPILTVMQFDDVNEMLAADALCPFGLTASVFGKEREAREVGAKMTVGTVMINDLIVPTVDPRVPFGGRKLTGFGTTRGAEGLLEMTAAKTTLVRHGHSVLHYGATGEHHETMFTGLAELTHGPTLRMKIKGLLKMMGGVKKLQREKA